LRFEEGVWDCPKENHADPTENEKASLHRSDFSIGSRNEPPRGIFCRQFPTRNTDALGWSSGDSVQLRCIRRDRLFHRVERIGTLGSRAVRSNRSLAEGRVAEGDEVEQALHEMLFLGPYVLPRDLSSNRSEQYFHLPASTHLSPADM